MTEVISNVSQLNILIVEDDSMLRVVMSMQVKLAGHSFRTAASGREALRMIKEKIPSVLILDVLLPDMTGQELIEELRKSDTTSALPMIVHTALDLSADEKAQMHLGHTRFVTKTTAFSEQLPLLITEVTTQPEETFVFQKGRPPSK